jgi:beta-glucosidase
VAEGGRNWEGFGADPYLAGKLGAVTIQGLQKSIIACIKHFVGNEQETNRNPLGTVPSSSSNIDDKTLHEIYMWPFQDAVHADVGSVMCSYNRLVSHHSCCVNRGLTFTRLDGTYACENDHVLNGLLKGELAFPGFVVSDFGAQHSGVKSAAAGLDLALPTSSFWDNGQLAKAVQNGTLPAERLQDMATRILASWYKFIGGPDGGFPPLGYGMAANQLQPHKAVDARDPSSKPTIFQSAVEGHVLVKNTNNALPLKKPLMLSLYGYDARIQAVNYPTSVPYSRWAFGLEGFNVSDTELLIALSGAGLKNPPQSAILGTLTGGGGSGAGTPSYISDPYSAIMAQAEEDDTFLLWDFQSPTPDVNPASNACLVFINDLALESLDRAGLADPSSNLLVKAVADKCPNTIVIIHNNGIRIVDSFVDHPNVTAILFAHTPGQASGKALVEVLYGKQSPSGRLPYTVPKNASDFGTVLAPCPQSPTSDPQCDYKEGENIDYRHFLANSIEPRYPFGYGLTYTTFSYVNMGMRWITSSPPTDAPNPGTTIVGGVQSIFENLASVTVDITNSGETTAAEVAQLYVQFPGDDKVRNLRGFEKVELAAKETKSVTFMLTRRDLSRWDSASQSWKLPTGSYKLLVGENVQKILLEGNLSR